MQTYRFLLILPFCEILVNSDDHSFPYFVYHNPYFLTSFKESSPTPFFTQFSPVSIGTGTGKSPHLSFTGSPVLTWVWLTRVWRSRCCRRHRRHWWRRHYKLITKYFIEIFFTKIKARKTTQRSI